MAFQPEPGTFYTIEDLEGAGVASKFTFRKWIKTGKLKASLVGRKYLISGEDLRDFLLNGSGAGKGGAPKGKHQAIKQGKRSKEGK